MRNWLNTTKTIKIKCILLLFLNSSRCADDTDLSKTYLECSYDEVFYNEFLGKHCDWNKNLAKTSTGSCSLGTFICINEQIICVGALNPAEEICDNIDNNCDGKIDNLENLIPELCYTGAQETVINYPCRAGIKSCINGEWMCRGQIIPDIVDICGDHIDNNCNGVIDDSNEIDSNRFYDFVLILDRSASMAIYTDQIRMILSTISHLDPQKFKIWILDLPLSYNLLYGPNLICHGTMPIYPLTSCDSANLDYLSRTWLPDQGSDELIYDLLYDITVDSNSFNWTSDSSIKYIIFFGDEEGQTRKGRTENQIAALFQNSSLVFIGFVEIEFDYDNIGQIYKLVEPNLYQLFEQHVLNTCQQ